MTIDITFSGGYQVHPTLVLGIAWEHQSRNVIHQLVGSHVPGVTIRAAGARRGTLALFFLTEETALEASRAHASATVCEFHDSDHPELDMQYVVDGRISVELDPEGRKRWVVSVEYQSITTAFVPL